MTKRIRYRVGQFFRALTARVSDEGVRRATRALTPEAQSLFRCQAAQDQRHALAVYHALRRAGHEDPHLLAAALLHDVGKAATRLSAVHRSIIVLLSHFAPTLLARLSRGEPVWWNRPFVTHARHPEIGAHWAEEVGCSPLVVELIRRHEEELTSCQTEQDRLLAALQAADDAN
jgi:putative nucleotidyltransferase with HDIG domain